MALTADSTLMAVTQGWAKPRPRRFKTQEDANKHNQKAQPLRKHRLWDMNTVRYLNESFHSIFSGNGNCCLRKFGKSTFGGRRRDCKFFCHLSNRGLIVKHAQCRKEHLFSSRQFLRIFL
jgi:hypothetical protein